MTASAPETPAKISRTVKLLGAVSFLTDVSSEMLQNVPADNEIVFRIHEVGGFQIRLDPLVDGRVLRKRFG